MSKFIFEKLSICIIVLICLSFLDTFAFFTKRTTRWEVTEKENYSGRTTQTWVEK